MLHVIVNQGEYPVGQPTRRGRGQAGSGWNPELGLARGSRAYAFKTNSLYKVGNCYYQTDNACARVKRVWGTLINRSAARHPAQSRVGKLARNIGDDGGHLIASRFYGTGQPINLVPMNSRINQAGGAWYRMEQDIDYYLRLNRGIAVGIDIVIHYPDEVSLRPSAFTVIVRFNAGRDHRRYDIINTL